MKRSVALLIPLLCLLCVSAFGQDPAADVQRAIDRINQGDAAAVSEELPSLVARYPNHPGVLYVQGLLTKDGAEALRAYQSIVDNFPKSEWADAALYKLHQYYYALGLYRTAELKLEQLKKDYPDSKYLKTPSGTGATPADERTVPSTPPVTTTPADSETDKQAQPLQTRWVLQVGAFTQQENAEKQKEFFESVGYTVELISRVRDTRTLFLVLVGDYRTNEEARDAAAEIKRKHNVDSFVIAR